MAPRNNFRINCCGSDCCRKPNSTTDCPGGSGTGEYSALVTSDADLLDIDEGRLAAELEAADLPPVFICHPKRLLKAMAP